MVAALRHEGVHVVVPEALSGDSYADASHPLTAGYATLADHLVGDAAGLPNLDQVT